MLWGSGTADLRGLTRRRIGEGPARRGCGARTVTGRSLSSCRSGLSTRARSIEEDLRVADVSRRNAVFLVDDVGWTDLRRQAGGAAAPTARSPTRPRCCAPSRGPGAPAAGPDGRALRPRARPRLVLRSPRGAVPWGRRSAPRGGARRARARARARSTPRRRSAPSAAAPPCGLSLPEPRSSTCARAERRRARPAGPDPGQPGAVRSAAPRSRDARPGCVRPRRHALGQLPGARGAGHAPADTGAADRLGDGRPTARRRLTSGRRSASTCARGSAASRSSTRRPGPRRGPRAGRWSACSRRCARCGTPTAAGERRDRRLVCRVAELAAVRLLAVRHRVRAGACPDPPRDVVALLQVADNVLRSPDDAARMRCWGLRE